MMNLDFQGSYAKVQVCPIALVVGSQLKLQVYTKNISNQ